MKLKHRLQHLKWDTQSQFRRAGEAYEDWKDPERKAAKEAADRYMGAVGAAADVMLGVRNGEAHISMHGEVMANLELALTTATAARVAYRDDEPMVQVTVVSPSDKDPIGPEPGSYSFGRRDGEPVFLYSKDVVSEKAELSPDEFHARIGAQLLEALEMKQAGAQRLRQAADKEPYRVDIDPYDKAPLKLNRSGE